MYRPTLALCVAFSLASAASAGVTSSWSSRSGRDDDHTRRNTSRAFDRSGSSSNATRNSDACDDSRRDVCSDPGNFTPPPSDDPRCDWRDDDRDDCDRVVRDSDDNCRDMLRCDDRSGGSRDCDRPRFGDDDCHDGPKPPCHDVPAPSGSIALAAAGLALVRRRRAR